MVRSRLIRHKLVAPEPVTPIAPARVAVSCRCSSSVRAQQISVALFDGIIADFDYCAGVASGQVYILGASRREPNLVLDFELANHLTTPIVVSL